MQPECIQVYVLSTDYPVFHSWLLSKKEKEKGGRIGVQQCRLWVRLSIAAVIKLSLTAL